MRLSEPLDVSPAQVLGAKFEDDLKALIATASPSLINAVGFYAAAQILSETLSMALVNIWAAVDTPATARTHIDTAIDQHRRKAQ